MGDAGEYWREHREHRRRRRLDRPRYDPIPLSGAPIKTPVRFTKKHAALGFRQCSMWHWQAKFGSEFLDYWPSKSKWRFGGVTTVGTEKQLRELVDSLKRVT